MSFSRIGSLGLVLAVLVSCLLPLRDASACGMFVPNLKVKAPPSMEEERTLILWDASTRRQHFVREVRFTNTGELPFGFIVPAPSRPEVNDVKNPPFDTLEARFPHTLLDTPADGFGAPGSKGGGEGFGRGIAAGGAPPVQVLEKKRIGDFQSFVLAATDAKALGDWLKKNQFKASPAGQKWIERYVKLGFFFVALRYEGRKQKADEGQALVSRAVRFSFDSPLPYYPYEEPEDAPEQRGRELQVWLVTQGFHVPLAPVAGKIRRPWSEGVRYEGEGEIASALGDELGALVPAGARLSTFGDWKEHRRGFGDLVLVPAEAEGCDAACVGARRPLMALLDPSLANATPLDSAALVVPPPAPRAPRKGAPRSQTPAIATGSPFGNSLTLGSGIGCGLGRSGANPAFLLVALAALGVARRTRRRSVTLLALGSSVALGFACASPPPPPPPPPPPATASAVATHGPSVVAEPAPELVLPGKLEEHTLPADAAERQKAVMRLLAGHHDDKLIPVWSTPGERGIGHARHTASNALRDPGEIEQRCAADPRVEGTLSYVVDSDETGATRALVQGPLPAPVLACVESTLVSAGPRIGRGVERGFLSLGALGPDVVSLRRGIKDAKLVSVRPQPGLSVKRVASTVTAGLPAQAVERVLRQNFGRFRFCYERDRHPAPKGSVTLKFGIGPGGAVTSMAATTADVAGTTGICIGNAVRELGFPAPEGGRSVSVSYTVGFERAK